MSGVKGKSGGPRANAGGPRPNSGGARLGAGRKRKEPAVVADTDMLKLLTDIALGKVDATQIQVRAAIAAVQYFHTKAGAGKKGQKQGAAEKAAVGKFTPGEPPKLALVK